MKVLLVSDSHGNSNNIVKAINRNPDINMVIHLGDILGDIFKVMKEFKHLRYEFVPGNNDWNSGYPPEKILDIEGKKVFITHGHAYNVKFDYLRLAMKGKSIGADAVFFGHTHIAEEVYSDGMLVHNPGSICLPSGFTAPTYSIAHIKRDKILTRYMAINK